MNNNSLKVRVIGIRSKILILGMICLVAISVAINVISYKGLKQNAINLASNEAATVSAIAASQIDGDVLSQLTEEDVNSEEWNEIVNRMLSIKEKSDIKYIYIP